MKRCARCNKVKELSDFGSDVTRSDGLNKYCRPCQRTIRKGSYYKFLDKNREVNRLARRPAWLKSVYGLTQEDIDRMKERQGNKCAICQRDGRLVIDHCHRLGHVRGLLCYRCNVSLGLIDDGFLDAALAYLNRTQLVSEPSAHS